MAKKTKNARWATAVPSQEEQYRLKRQTLIREAGKAFSRKGFHNTSMNDVAEMLNVTKPALYYYIKTKQEILFECHAYALDLGEQARSFAWARSDRPLERLSLLIGRYVELLTGSFGSYAALLEPISSLEPHYREQIRARLREFDRVFLGLIEAAMADGSLPPVNPKLAVAFFMGAINNISRWYSPAGPSSGPEIAKAFCGFIFDGLRGPAAARRALAPNKRKPAAKRSRLKAPAKRARAPARLRRSR